MRALTTAATGLEAQQANVERIANDLANVNTDGYKRSRNEFQELMYETIKPAGESIGASSQTPVGVQIGMGVKVGAIHKNHEQGPARITSYPYDVMIEGPGYFPVSRSNGGGAEEILYTRVGAFHRDKEGRLMLASGAQLVPPVVVPSNATSLIISANGEIKATLPNAGEAVLGQIQLVRFPNEEGLEAVGKGLFKPSLSSGQPLQGIPGENSLGTVAQGMLEGSNVNVANSMVDMIAAQRAYEMGTKVMSTVDQMLGSTTNVIK